MSETAVVAIVSALFGLIGGLATSVPSALKLRAEAKLAAKQSDLDHLRAVIDELQEEIERRKKDRAEERKILEARIQALEDNCDEKDRLIGELETQIHQLTEERSQLEARISALVRYIDLLTEVMQSHNIPVPERKRNEVGR